MVSRRNSRSNESHPFAREVVQSLERTGLDRETTLVLGGGALALAGIRRAGDIDLMVPYYGVFNRLSVVRRLPNGLALQEKYGAKHPFLETTPAHLPRGVMAVDITHPHDERDHKPSYALDQALLREIASFDRVGGYAFLPPELVANHKTQRTGIPSRKDRKDLRLIRQHLQDK